MFARIGRGVRRFAAKKPTDIATTRVVVGGSLIMVCGFKAWYEQDDLLGIWWKAVEEARVKAVEEAARVKIVEEGARVKAAEDTEAARVKTAEDTEAGSLHTQIR